MRNSIIEEKIKSAVDLLNSVTEFSNKIILDENILNAASICRIYDELAFADFRSKCKAAKGVALTIFNDAVTKHSKRIRKEFAKIEESTKIIQLKPSNENIFALPELPNGLKLKIPPEYTCSINGIVTDKVTAGGKHKTKFVAYSPFFVVERFKNVDDQSEKYKIAIYNVDGWNFITANRYDFAEEHKIVSLSRFGLGIDSVIARDTVTYVSELVRCNMKIIPLTKIFNKIGWRDNFSEFIYPPNGENYIVEDNENDEFNLIYTSKGDRQKFLNFYDKIKIHRYARLAFAAALAASFIEILNLRNMTLCIWGRSGGGKTAGVIKFPMAIHGDPKFVPTFNSTFVSLERRVVMSNNLPFAVDELQNITSKFQSDNIDKFAHIIGEGVSKGRTIASGKLENLKRFSTIALITGEQPLTNFTSDQGKKRRTLEIYCREVLPKELAEKTHEFTAENFGLIGREWINFIKDHIDNIKSLYKFFREDFRSKRSDAIIDHTNFLAATCAADVLFNVYFRNINFNAAFNEICSENQIYKILNDLSTEIETSNSERAKEFIKEYIKSRKKHFLTADNDIVQDPIFGQITDDFIILYTFKLKDELKRVGFSPEKIIDELIEEEFFTRDDKGRLILKKILIS